METFSFRDHVQFLLLDAAVSQNPIFIAMGYQALPNTKVLLAEHYI
jgi:hypothetical protein